MVLSDLYCRASDDSTSHHREQNNTLSWKLFSGLLPYYLMYLTSFDPVTDIQPSAASLSNVIDLALSPYERKRILRRKNDAWAILMVQGDRDLGLHSML